MTRLDTKNCPREIRGPRSAYVEAQVRSHGYTRLTPVDLSKPIRLVRRPDGAPHKKRRSKRQLTKNNQLEDGMTTAEVGTKLCDLCREGRNIEAINELYSADIISVEATEGDGFPRTMTGLDAVRGKSEWWYANHEIHGGDVKGPFFHGDDQFAAHFVMDITQKESGQRFNMEEVALYTVSDGKIVKEEFFYNM